MKILGNRVRGLLSSDRYKTNVLIKNWTPGDKYVGGAVEGLQRKRLGKNVHDKVLEVELITRVSKCKQLYKKYNKSETTLSVSIMT